MRFSTPVVGTPESSRVPAASLPKSTSAWKAPMSPVASAEPWRESRHQRGSAAVPAALETSGSGSSKRKAALKNAVEPGPPPPGRDAVREPSGVRYAPAAGSQSPTPAARRTTPRPGSQAECGTRTSIWRRSRSTATLGVPRGAPVAASSRSALEPCTVRNSEAGAVAPAPCGNGSGAAELPIAIVAPTRSGSRSEFSVSRNAVAPASGFTRSSTRSAALSA